MKKLLVISFLIFLGIVACTNRDGEIIDLINSVKKQNDDLKAQITALKKTTDSALVAVLKVNSAQLITDKKIDLIQADLKALLTQIASLNTQMSALNADIGSLKAKIDALQAKCAELVSQIALINSSNINYILTIDISPLNSGKITIIPSGSSFKSGSEISITPTPLTGYVFKQWTGDIISSANPLKVTMNGNKKLTAVFELISSQTGNIVTDLDGNVYNTVTIGTQTWMAENLKTTKYSNGESITYVDKTNEGSWNGTGSYRVYNDNIQNKSNFGLLYNGQSVFDIRNICPKGWHVPSENDWQILELTIGLPQLDLRTEGFRGQDLNIGGKLKQKGFVNWNSPNLGATDQYVFNAIAAGRWTGGYIFLYNETGFWTSTSETNDYNAWIRVLGYGGQWILKGKYNGGGFSCRCVKD
jgi:uncharacterized protein (TIGR02145 family)